MATITRIDLLTGGGNSPEALAAYSQAMIVEFADVTPDDLDTALAWGLRNVQMYGKFTFATACQFVREWKASFRPLTRADAMAKLRAIGTANGLSEGTSVPIGLWTDDIKEILLK